MLRPATLLLCATTAVCAAALDWQGERFATIPGVGRGAFAMQFHLFTGRGAEVLAAAADPSYLGQLRVNFAFDFGFLLAYGALLHRVLSDGAAAAPRSPLLAWPFRRPLLWGMAGSALDATENSFHLAALAKNSLPLIAAGSAAAQAKWAVLAAVGLSALASEVRSGPSGWANLAALAVLFAAFRLLVL